MHTNHLALAPIRTVTLSVAAALMLVTALPSAHAQAESSAPSSTSSGLTRAEVVADLRLWQRAGVDRFADLQEYGLQTEAYQRALAEYQRLRNGPAFAEEVARIKGEHVTRHAGR